LKPVNVLCIKWGKKYGPDYVNTLYSMVRRNLSRPFRFICLTDDWEGIRDEIEVNAFPKVGFEDFDKRLPWTMQQDWLKLTAFAKPLYDLEGPTLLLDLDLVIVGSLDEFFDVEGDFILIREGRKSRPRGNAAVCRFTAGAHGELLEQLAENPDEAKLQARTGQNYLTRFFAEQGNLSYWPAEWCQSFKRHCVRPFPLHFFQRPRLPEATKIIVFNSDLRPDDALVGRSGKWYRKVLPTGWIADHWR
jgi:hypothetical protein